VRSSENDWFLSILAVRVTRSRMTASGGSWRNHVAAQREIMTPIGRSVAPHRRSGLVVTSRHSRQPLEGYVFIVLRWERTFAQDFCILNRRRSQEARANVEPVAEIVHQPCSGHARMNASDQRVRARLNEIDLDLCSTPWFAHAFPARVRGAMFRFERNTLSGSYFFLTSTRRSKLAPYVAQMRSSSSSAVWKLM
jgi:hypothetical protein